MFFAAKNNRCLEQNITEEYNNGANRKKTKAMRSSKYRKEKE